MEAIEVMKQAYAEHVPPGTSIADMIETNKEQMLVAETQQQKEEGLRNQPPGTSMAFPNVNGESFNTNGMKEPIDINGLDKNGDLVQSYKAVPPGVDNIPMGPEVDTVIENPTQYKTGGWAGGGELAQKMNKRRRK